MVYIYVLKLEGGKYYVGKTNNPRERINQHLNGKGSEWTRKYQIEDVIELIPDCDDYDEDKYTRIYMDKYGINNVRGGSFSSIRFTDETYKALQDMTKGSNDLCFNCGKKGHYARDCPYEEVSDEEDSEDEDYCERCGRDGHNESECYAKKDIDGRYIRE